MRRILIPLLLIYFLLPCISFAQNNEIKIDAQLFPKNHELKIQQSIIFHNKSGKTLDTIYLHDWANGYADKKSPLSKRLLNNYNKDLYFAKEKNRGSTAIQNISADFNSVTWNRLEKKNDIIEVILNQPLQANEKITLSATYTVKIPSDKFTRYGRNKRSYNLRFWHLVPAVYDIDWKLMNNLDMDDLLVDLSNYSMNITVPKKYTLSSDLSEVVIDKGDEKTYQLNGENRLDIELNISKVNEFEIYNTTNIEVETNLKSKGLSPGVKTDILNREIAFIEKHLGVYPHKKILINNITYAKNPVYGLNQLPSFLRPFSDVFEWDIKMFKALTRKYLDNSLYVDKREDSWLVDGLQSYLMMEYITEFYPEMKATGNISKIWGVRKFNLAQLKFNDKYPLIYQFAARKNVDQPLTMRADSLSNFNRKIVNKYKAGLGIRYLNEYLGDSIVPKTLKKYYNNNTLKFSQSNNFQKLITQETNKDLKWFFGDYVQSKKKIDYTIDKVSVNKDSIDVTIRNKREMSAPVALYGVKDKKIHFKKWLTGIDSTKTVSIPKNGFDRLSLNYEYLYPEFNLRDNWESTEKKLFNRPIQLKFLKDVEDPYYNQLYYTPIAKYNLYDGLQLGMALSNKTFLRKSFTYKLSPYYGTTSKSITGSASALYEYLPKNSKVNRYLFGIAGSYFHYADNLSYRSISPYMAVQFRRKSLRDVGGSAIFANYVNIKRDLDPTSLTQNPESNKYSVFNVGFSYSKPDIIEDVRHTTNLELGDKFSKLTFDFRYRKLTDKNRQFDFRFYAGTFLTNKTKTDFFDFGLTKQNDYLFRLDYLGRSEGSGFFSQQYITNEGGFKSTLEKNYANQWIATFNTSVGLWRWAEIYNDVGFLKSRNEPVYFAYENGVRLNFVHEILEVYFPLYSNNGWEVTQPNYSSRIRFVLTVNPKKIIDFVRRGFY